MRVSLAAALLILLSAVPLSSRAAPAPWTLTAEPPHALPTLSRGGAKALTSTYVFWKKDWAWSGLDAKYRVAAPLEYAITGKNTGLGFELDSDARTASPRTMQWSLDLDAPSLVPGVIGGGISFRFDLETFRNMLGEPEILPGNRGWAWGRPGASRIEMRFDPPLQRVYYERGQKSEIRCFFYDGAISPGPKRYVATVTMTEDMAVAPTIAERFGLDDPQSWPADILDWRTSPVDLSFLNAPERPAGKRGFVRAVGDKLMFEDGTVARFWGTNLTAGAIFGTSAAGIKQQARRLSQLGFNLVRLHHHDSAWVNPNIFGDAKAPDTQTLSPAALEKIDAWIAALKAEGIYIWLDLHVGRQLKAGDGITAFDEIAKGKPAADLRGYNYVNDSIKAAMKRFNAAYVTHVNRYTGLAYKDEPAIAAMLITNENDLTHHFGNSLLPDKKVSGHTARYMHESDAFASQHGLPRDATWRSWQHGPSKLFLSDLERRFNVEMIEHLRDMGVRVPLVTTNHWGYGPLSSLPALTSGDLIDGHSYGDVGDLETDPLIAPGFIHWLAAGQVVGKPYVVSEWNIEAFPAPDRHTAPLYIASRAAHQAWVGVMLYAYAQVPLDAAQGPSNWHAFNDPSMIATLPAAALLFRRGDVAPATTSYVFAPPAAQLYNDPIHPGNSAALRTAAEKGRLLIAMPATRELPWLVPSPLPSDAHLIEDPRKGLIPVGATEVTSDTGQLRRDWSRGTYTIRTPRTQFASGWIGGQPLALDDLDVSLVTRHASVAAQSLTDAPLGASDSVLISVSARSVTLTPHRLPFRSEPVIGEVVVRAPPDLTAYALTTTGKLSREIESTYRDGKYRISLSASLGTLWVFLGKRP